MTGASSGAFVVGSPNASSAGRRAASGTERDETEGAPAGALGENPHAVGEQARVAAELVDDEAHDGRAILVRERGLRAENLGEHAAAVDVGDEDDRAAGGAGEAHVGDVAVAQIDLRRAAGAFDDDEVGLGLEARKAREHGVEELWFQRLVLARLGGADHPALHDDLRADLALRLQKHRVHVDGRGDAAGAGLERLRPADLAPVRGDRGVVRHVLRLERPDREPAAGENAAEPGDDQRLADVRARALEHQRPGGHGRAPLCSRGR